ncbi:amidohydrolase family protein [Amycolatopsis cihanbeyliensis]|uniref:Cytosine/adenosine deaminase-related metal-dependent hydrolase n=1 Tax=Amycolatopsis cihanbeyliensis TaxID=1128664 RepID=A0A542DPU5_AMYCI|nr:amidohydrolase family protein [Amycolatopsis cihanbeyliensis]TQJ05130.1 cytosine/adenosine deaminase-related metal-dependent hydrolase [Amycolatopsis cihanbeyliensis]
MNSSGPLLIRGGFLYPADDRERVIPDGAVLVEEGRIAAVGGTTEVEAALTDRPRTIEASGKLILPGFVNPHWHDMFATRFPFKGALRDPSDREDRPAFMALGGDIQRISMMFDSFCAKIDLLGPDEAAAIARYSMWTQLRSGVTTLGDVGSFNRPEALAAAARELGMRCVVSTWASDAVCAPGESRFRRTRDADVVLGRVESLLDTCAAERGGLVRARPTSVYGVNMTDELGAGFAELVARYDVPFATHLGALRNEVEVMRTYYGATPVRRFAELGLLSDRFMAVHCAFADEDERKLLAEANAHINFSPAKYGPAGESSLTETGAMPEFRRRGLDLSLSTDGAPMPVGGMAEAMRAVWQTFNEMSADPTEVRPTDALAMATRIPARGLDWAEEIGSLEVGKQADLLLIPATDWRYLLNPRPLEGFLALGGSMDIDTVLVAGRVLVEGGRPTCFDEHDVEADYLEALAAFSVRCLGVDPDLVAAHTRRAQRAVRSD